MTNDLTVEQAVGELKAMKEHIEPHMSVVGVTAYDMAIKALEKQPCEDCVSRSELQKTMDSLPLFRFVNNDHEEADDYYNCESVDMVIRNLPSVTPRTNLAETSQDCISREEMLKYQQYLHGKMSNEENHKLWNFIKGLPSVTPKYTDEEIDKAQAVEQAYVDNMVELAVEEIKERYSDAIGKMKKAIDEMTEIHSDGEFYIKNVDAKWIISKYLCGAEMSGGEEDEVSD